MTTFREEKTGPNVGAVEPVETKKQIAGESLGISDSTEGSGQNPADSLDAFTIGQQLQGLYVAVAEIKSPGPEKRFRRYYFANLPSAQRRVDKAREAGREAYLYLGQIHIVGGDLDV